MSESWLACPYCDLAFFNEENYKTHFSAEHKDRKIRKVALIRSQARQFD
jgi:hypothetical protein